MARSKVKPAAASEPIEGPWALPQGWCWRRLGDAVEVHDNLRRPLNQSERNARLHYNPDAELYPYYGATGQVGQIDAYLADGEYVLLGEDGAPFLDRDKNKAYLVAGRFWANNHAHVLRAGNLFCNRWLLHWLNTVDYRGIVNGTTRLKLTQGAMNEMPVPVPLAGHEEQIIARIDELFTEVDDGEAALERARGDLATWRKALLKAAVTGELTADWRAANPPSETGGELLARIKLHNTERRQPKDEAQKGATNNDRTEPFLLPAEWAWSKISAVASNTLTGLDRSAELQSQNPLHTPYIKMGDISMSGRVATSANRRVMVSSEEKNRFGLRQGDILFNTRNSLELVGKTGLIRSISEATVYNNNLMRIRLHPEINPDYAILWLCSPPFRHRLETVKRATTSVAAVYGKDLYELPIPIPPQDEQAEVVRHHARLDDDTRDMPSVGTTLRQSILAAAFRGDLVA